MFYILGDSHTCVFSNQNLILPVNSFVDYDEFKCFHMGPLLAYKCHEKTDILTQISLSEKDSIIFCFGEIDMRNIHKRVTESDSYELAINKVIENYFLFINHKSDINKIVFGVIPCLKETPFYDWFKNNPETLNEFYAPSGTLEIRNKYKKYFNSQLELKCQELNIKYFDIFNEVLGQEELYMDDIHASSTKVISIIKQKLSKL